MPSKRKTRARLTDAIGSDRSVQLQRVSRPGQTIDGFVIAVGKEWALLSRTMEGGFFDGHVAIRLSEIAGIRADGSFQSAFARTQPEWPPTPPHGKPIDLDSTRGMLSSMLRAGELFGIERDKKYDATWIGVPHELTQPWLYMWEVSPDASWDEQPLGYRLRTITMVTINDHYQRGLTAIAGPAPAHASPSDWAQSDR